MKRIYAIIASVAALVVTLDQYTKYLALDAIRFEGQTVPFISWFNFTLVFNRGAAFGVLSNLPESVRNTFFYILIVGVLFFIWFSFIRKLSPSENFVPAVMGLVFGGAIGNLFDRVRYSYVVDFIDWSYPSVGKCIPLFYHMTFERCHWPKFNIADSAITIAAISLVIHSFVADYLQKKKS